MRLMRRIGGGVLALSLLWSAATALAQPPAKDASREAMLHTIGMLAGQGLLLGHEALAGLAARYDKRLATREAVGQTLADMGRYAELVQAAFKERLMNRLGPEERRGSRLASCSSMRSPMRAALRPTLPFSCSSSRRGSPLCASHLTQSHSPASSVTTTSCR